MRGNITTMSDIDPDPEPSSRSLKARLKDGFSYLWRKVTRKDEDHSAREAIEELIEEDSHNQQSIEPDERMIIGNVLNLRDLEAEDIMIPRAEIIAVSIDIKGEELVEAMSSNKLSRLPIYKDTLDDVIGFAHIKDILTWATTDEPFDINKYIREVLVISPAMRSTELLIKMRESGTKMAMVVDEFGGIDGLVTMTDLIEEIIGDVTDTTQGSQTYLLVQRSDGSIVADARVTIEELGEGLGLHLDINGEDEDINTLGGLAVSVAEKVPEVGEKFETPYGVEIEILEADSRRVKRLCLRQTKSFKMKS